MALDGLLMHTLCSHLQILKDGKIGKIQNISEDEILIHIHTKMYGNQKLVINIHSNTNRIYLNDSSVELAPSPSVFVMVLRKLIGQGYITAIDQMGYDRIIRFTIRAYNEFADETIYELYAELMGKYANLVLVQDKTIVDAAKRIPIYENSKRLIHPGAEYTLPEQKEKKDPFHVKEIDTQTSLVAQIQGFSPLLSREFLYRLKNNEKYEDILNELVHSENLFIYSSREFHCLQLKHLSSSPKIYKLMEGMNHLYTDKEKQARIKEQCGDIIKTAQREYKRLKKKLPKLEQTYELSKDYQKYQEYGELLFVYMHELTKQPVIELESFTTGDIVKIPIDMRYDLKDNANLFYKKYHKLKRGQSILLEQIEQCKEDLAYYEQLLSQLEYCSIEDAQEIRQELVNKKVMYEKIKKGRKKKKSSPNILHLHVDDSDIYIGKNNLQNQYITHQLARKQDLWFHVKDYHGSHVLLKSEEPNEKLIRMCAQLASYFSKSRYSSSVPVDYTTVSMLKKVPKAQIGFVTMKNYKTIYIDPQADEIEKWLEKYKVKQ